MSNNFEQLADAIFTVSRATSGPRVTLLCTLSPEQLQALAIDVSAAEALLKEREREKRDAEEKRAAREARSEQDALAAAAAQREANTRAKHGMYHLPSEEEVLAVQQAEEEERKAEEARRAAEAAETSAQAARERVKIAAAKVRRIKNFHLQIILNY
jgi:hypothetical protein